MVINLFESSTMNEFLNLRICWISEKERIPELIVVEICLSKPSPLKCSGKEEP